MGETKLRSPKEKWGGNKGEKKLIYWDGETTHEKSSLLDELREEKLRVWTILPADNKSGVLEEQ